MRTHRPVINRALCEQCVLCLGACPGNFLYGLRYNGIEGEGAAAPRASLDPAPCVLACPLGQQVRDYIRLLGRGQAGEAALLIRRDNPLPGVCAYICHHPCQPACTRAETGPAVAIRDLKRRAIEYEMEHRDEIAGVLLEQREADLGRYVSIVGAGPAGLACASALAMKGCRVTVFDALAEPGGMLSAAIPMFRLPRHVLRHDIAMLATLGVEFVCSCRLGRETSIEGLQAGGADAVVLATGAWSDLLPGIPGEDNPGFYACLDFLKAANAGQIELRGVAVVVGGGNAAVDAARTCLRVGASRAVIAYRRGREEMPALSEEIEAALAEGVEISYLVSPLRVIAEAGKIRGVELQEMALGKKDNSGRRRPVAVPGSIVVQEADTVIMAIGQRPDLSFIDRKAVTRNKTIRCAQSGLVQPYGAVFAAGDAVTGPSTVVQAMASGKAAAANVIGYLEKEKGR